MVNPHLDNGTPWGGSAPYERPMRPERPPGQPSSGPHTGYGGGYSPHDASHQGYNPRPNIGRDRMGIMSQPGGYGSDTYNALMGGVNKSRQGGGFDRRKWSSALGHPEMAAVDPSDWRTILKILQAGGDPGTETQTAQMGGYGYNPAPKSYNDIYKGTDIIDMEVLPGAGYGPDDEYDFDYKRDRFEDLLPGTWPQYAARGGLMSLRR